MPSPLDFAPMGASLTGDGATFRVWAPRATAVSVRGTFSQWRDVPLQPIANGHWAALVPGVMAGDEYKFWVDGVGSSGPKRDPYARALTVEPAFPLSNCVVLEAQAYPWHDRDFRPPAPQDWVIYQLHVGAFYAEDAAGVDVRRSRPGRFLDLLFRIDYLASLGITAVQLLPIQEFATERSLGYNGVDYFSPEMDYTVAPDDPDFPRYLAKCNALLAARGCPPIRAEQLAPQPHQLMAVVDLLHLSGIAVILDVVYNHAGGDFGDESIYFFDRQPTGDNNRSLYFTNQGWAGGLVFAYWQAQVRQFLIDNATSLIDDYHLDGYRMDEVTVIDRYGGWSFAQDLTNTLRFKKPDALLIAEYWADADAVLRPTAQGGAGFHAVLASELRSAVRSVLAQAAHGASVAIDLDQVAGVLDAPSDAPWRRVQHLENQDIVRINNTTDGQPRVPAVADGHDSRSWFARSRSRVANGLLLTAPGTPMLFMGQECLEDKQWSDSPDYFANSLIWWDGVASDAAMGDHLVFMQALLAVRAHYSALRRGWTHVFHVHNANRVLAFQRKTEDERSEVVVVISLREQTWWRYDLGFPRAGEWREVFNSDVYDRSSVPVVGNEGRIEATGGPLHGFPASASLTIPANSILVFARTDA